MVVLTNEAELKSKIRDDLTKERVFDEKKVEERFNEIIGKKKEALEALPARSYLSVGTGKFVIKILRIEKQIAKHINSCKLRQEPSFGDFPKPQRYGRSIYANQSTENLSHAQGRPGNRRGCSCVYDLAQFQVRGKGGQLPPATRRQQEVFSDTYGAYP